MKSNSERLIGLDGLRAIAALLVCVFHLEVMTRGQPIADLSTQYALLGVELFFVISGFAILMTAERSASVAAFAVNRIVRLYPAYIFSVLITFAYLRWAETVSVLRGLANLTMLQEFAGINNLTTVYWSLSFELWFYAVITLVIYCGWLKHIATLCAVWLVVASALRFAGYHPIGLAGILSMLQFGHLFIAGMMIYRISSDRASSLTYVVLFSAVAYAAFGRRDWSLVPPPIYFVAIASFVGLVYLAGMRRLEGVTPSWLAFVGTLSYSLYLLHPVVFFIVLKFGLNPFFQAALALTISICLAWISREQVELKGGRALKLLLTLAVPKPQHSQNVQGS